MCPPVASHSSVPMGLIVQKLKTHCEANSTVLLHSSRTGALHVFGWFKTPTNTQFNSVSLMLTTTVAICLGNDVGFL